MCYRRTPEFPQLVAAVAAGPGQAMEVQVMKEPNTASPTAAPATMQRVFDRISAKEDLPDTRKRDLRSSVAIYGKIVERPLTEIPLDLAAIRKMLDGVVPLQAKISRKR